MITVTYTINVISQNGTAAIIDRDINDVLSVAVVVTSARGKQRAVEDGGVSVSFIVANLCDVTTAVVESSVDGSR